MDSATPFQPWASSDGSKNVKSEGEIVDDAKHHRENVNHPKHQTASYEQESVLPTRINPGPSSTAGSEGDSSTPSREAKMDNSKISSMQQIVENTLSPEGRQRVVQILEAVDAMSSAERLLLYLRLPTGMPPHDPLKQPINPLGSRAELQQTVTWIKSHLEVDPDVSLPKQDVYDDYVAHCMSCTMKPLSTADFGKVMKQVYPSVRPRRLGTRGNSRYCYAGLRKKIKLEVPQLPDLGESSKEIGAVPRESERIVCDWAEAKLGIKFASIRELSRHIATLGVTPTRPARPASGTPPLVPTHHGPSEDPASRQLMKQLKRKLQTQGTPGRPKKNKEVQESPPSTSYLHHPSHPPLPLKHEEVPPDPYAYPPQYMAVYEPPRYMSTRPHPIPGEPYREPYPYEPPYAHREPEPTLNLPINLSADTSLDLSTDRARPPPDPSPTKPHQRFPPLPGKKLILETYQSEQAGSPRHRSADEYLPKKMRAAEILGGKLAATRHHAEPEPTTSEESFARQDPTASTEEYPPRPEGAFLEDPKNATRRSKSTAAALARERQDAASPPAPAADLDHITIKTAICESRHSELFHRERVISICNIDKHDLDDYLNEGSSQDHDQELLQYFHKEHANTQAPRTDVTPFLETGLDPPDDRAQGKTEKLSQLRKLLAKNLKTQSGPGSNQSLDSQPPLESDAETIKLAVSEGAFKPVVAGSGPDIANGNVNGNGTLADEGKQRDRTLNKNEPINPYEKEVGTNQAIPNVPNASLYNGNGPSVPQSPTTRTQQYDFVPISDRCHSPGSFSQRGNSPSKVNQPTMGGSLQTSPISHSTTVSPFVSPRNTPVPRSRLCSRPIPKHTGRRYRRTQLSLGVPCNPRQFAAPNEQKFMNKSAMYQPMSAPPSPNILTSQYRNHMFPCNPLPNGINTSGMNNFVPNLQFRETMNGDLAQPLSADPLSSEISQFFQDPVGTYRVEHDNSFRSQSVPLKQGLNNMCMMSYSNTPAGSVPPTPVPNEFSDFGSLTDTCDISKAGLNPETLVKIYNAIDSSEVLNGGTDSLLNPNDALVNGCDSLTDQPILTDDHLNSLIPESDPMLNRDGQFSGEFGVQVTTNENVEDYLKRTNSMEMTDLSDLVEKNKYYSSRSVPSTPLPYKRIPNLHIDPRRSRELFAAENFNDIANGISSKSVPSTPQLVEERSMFSYSNRDFLINGNSVDACSTHVHGPSVDNSQSLTSPLEICDDIADSLTPDTDLLPELDVNLDI